MNLSIYSNINVTFSGASVTGQKISYVTELQKIYPNWDVSVHSYPSSSMTRCSTQPVFLKKVDIIFYEWSLHGESTTEEIREILWLSIKQNSVPVFLHMPRVDGVKLNLIEKINKLSEKIGITVIDLRESFSQKQLKDEYLRDNCHPNPLGAKAYAKFISAKLEEANLRTPKIFDLGYDIKDIKYERVNYLAYKNMSINIDGKI